MRTTTPIALMLAAATCPAVAQPCNPWEVVPSENAPGAERTYVRSIEVIAPDDVWVVGESFNGSQIQVFSMHFDGASWTVVPVPDPNGSFADSGLWAVDASGPDNLWAAGHREYTPTGIPFAFFGTHNAVWRWTGSAWQLMPTPQLGGGSGDFVWELAAIAPDNVWFVGDGHPTANGPQPALAMRWNGSGFELTEVPLVNPEAGRDAGNPLYDISVLAPNDIWAVGGTDVNATGAHDYSQIHHWDGNQWTHVPGPTPGFFNQLFCVAAVSPSDVWAAGEVWETSGNIRPFLIHWDGSTWTEVPAPGGFLDMVALASDDIWAVGNDIFHYDGESWTLVQSFPQVPFPALASVDALGPCELWAAGRQIEGDTGFRSLVVRTSGGGACASDWDGDGAVNSNDISTFLAAWLAGVQGGTLAADFNADGLVNSLDISAFLAAWLAAVQGGC